MYWLKPLAFALLGSIILNGGSTTSGGGALAPTYTVGTPAALGSTDATAVVSADGFSGCGVSLAAGTLAGTVYPEVSCNGTTWTATNFIDVNGNVAGTKVFTNPSAAWESQIALSGCARQCRVHLNPYTSGTATATMYAFWAVATGNSVLLADVGGTTKATIKAASTAPTDTDTALVVSQTSPGCAGQRLADTTFTPFSIAATGSTKIITGTSAKKTYLCHIALAATGGANNVGLIEGTGTNCATGTAGMAGGTTAATGLGNVAQGGFVFGDGYHVINKSATAADDICLITSASGQVSGVAVWVQF